MRSTLRVALVSPYDFAHPGGVNEHIRHLARHLRGRGHHVEILAPVSNGQVDEEGLVRLETGIVPVPFGGSIARVSLSPATWGQVKELLGLRYYDIVHVHEPTTPVISPAVLYHSRSVNVGTFHQYRESHPGYDFGRPLLRYFVERLHGRIAVSEAARSFVKNYFPGEYRVIPNGIEVAAFQSPEARPWEGLCEDGRLNILFVGRLEKRKGFRHLLRAFRIVKKVVPEARLFVVGAFDREDRLPYVRYVRHFRIRDVKFIGQVSNADKIRWYKSAHIFCAPSTGFESFGIVLTEAMAAGAPVVASNIAGYRDVVRPGVTGELVPPEDEEALAAVLVGLLRAPERREALRAAALQEVLQYDWAQVSLGIEAYYRELLAGQKDTLAPSEMEG